MNLRSAGTSHSGSDSSGGLKTGEGPETGTTIGSINAFSKKGAGLYYAVFNP